MNRCAAYALLVLALLLILASLAYLFVLPTWEL